MRAGKIAHLTDLEERLLTLVEARTRKGATVSTAELVEVYYAGQDRPINANTVIRDRLSMIEKKLRHNGDPRSIRKSHRAGPHPVEFWIEKAAA